MTESNQTVQYGTITDLAKSAVTQAIERQRKLGESIAVWQDGKVVVLTADQIPIMQEPKQD
jgi:hypothetical protein